MSKVSGVKSVWCQRFLVEFAFRVKRALKKVSGEKRVSRKGCLV